MANGTLKVSNIETSSGSGTITLGQSGETISVPSGATINLSSATQTGVGGVNTPAFEAYRSDNQGISDGAWTKVQFDVEEFDTNSMYDNSTNYRFTPTTAGKYLCYYVVRGGNDGGSTLNNVSVKFYKNGSNYQTGTSTTTNFYNNPGANATQASTQIVNFNGSSDYLEVFCYIDTTTGSPDVGQNSIFGAMKIIE